MLDPLLLGYKARKENWVKKQVGRETKRRTRVKELPVTSLLRKDGQALTGNPWLLLVTFFILIN